LLTECVKFSFTDLPSTTQVTDAGGFEFEVVHSNLRLSPTFASLGPLIVTLSGATAKKIKKFRIFFLRKFFFGGQSDVLVPTEALETYASTFLPPPSLSSSVDLTNPLTQSGNVGSTAHYFVQKCSLVGTSSEGSDITEIFPKLKKSQFPKLAKTKFLEKNRLSQGLSFTNKTGPNFISTRTYRVFHSFTFALFF